MQTIPINDDPNFRALEAHINAALSLKRFLLVPRKGSSSWIDKNIKPADAAVRFKLCFFPGTNIFFGARKEWANQVPVQWGKIGIVCETVHPSPVLFRGDYVHNNAAGRRRIDAIIALLFK
jgi:hypothetical protein